MPGSQTVPNETSTKDAKVASVSYRKSMIVFCLAILGGVAITQPTWLISLGFQPTRKTPSKPTSYSTIFDNLQCQQGGSLEACVESVCDQVAMDLSPLNKPRIGEYMTRGEDLENLNQIRGQTYKNALKSAAGVRDRFIAQGIKNERLMNYLQYRGFLLEQSITPNCAGGAAKVAVILSQQPIILSQNTTLNYDEVKHKSLETNKEKFIHTILRVSSESFSMICDPWNLSNLFQRVNEPVGICRSEDIKEEKNKKCSMYQDNFWTKNPEKSYVLKAPDISKLSSQEMMLYLQEISRQDKRFAKLQNKKTAKKQKKKKNPDDPSIKASF